MPNSNSSQDIRFMLPETIWLEPEHFLVAQQISYPGKTDPDTSWQAYLNALALLGFEIWLQKRLPDKVITKDTSMLKAGGSLKVDGFKFCAIATQNVLSEIVSIPSLVVDKPQYSAHFYVVLEVLEEEEEVIIRGFLPHNQLVEIIYNLKLPNSEAYYHIPLNLFDIEPNHLLFYQRYVQASEFAPSLVNMDSQVNQSSQNLSNIVSTTTTKLSHWLEGVFEESWQALDSLYKPELNLAFSTRNSSKDTKRSKIIDLGINLDNHKVVLLIGIYSDVNEDKNQDRISVVAQLRPMAGDMLLPENIKLILISKAGKVLQEITSRVQDNCIQLNTFKGERGKKFSIKVSLGNSSITENFEL